MWGILPLLHHESDAVSSGNSWTHPDEFYSSGCGPDPGICQLRNQPSHLRTNA